MQSQTITTIINLFTNFWHCTEEGASMPRAIWKGAITFGLVHVPVALYPASQEVGIDFDWLDKRSMDPVG